LDQSLTVLHDIFVCSSYQFRRFRTSTSIEFVSNIFCHTRLSKCKSDVQFITEISKVYLSVRCVITKIKFFGSEPNAKVKIFF